MAREERVSATKDREGARGRPPDPKETARPQILASEEDTQRTDVQEGSGAVHRRSVARWHTPRPAGLGWATRPHLAASRLLTSRGSQAPPPLLLTTGAT